MSFPRHLFFGAVVLAMAAVPGNADAEIVERELGTDAAGNAVKGYVFQAGRGFGRTARRSSLPVRRVSRSRWSNRGIRTGHGYSHFYLPLGAFYYGAPSSFCRVPARYFVGGASFSVRVHR